MRAAPKVRRGPDGEAWLSSGQAARRMQVSVRTVHRWVKDGRFPRVHYTLGGDARIPQSDIDQLLAATAYTPDGGSS